MTINKITTKMLEKKQHLQYFKVFLPSTATVRLELKIWNRKWSVRIERKSECAYVILPSSALSFSLLRCFRSRWSD